MRISVLPAFVVFFSSILCSAQPVSGQVSDSLNRSDLYDLSLEELMSVEVELASKQNESLFDAPLSATVITRQEIENSGITTISELFTLVPGLIVRQQCNGNYDMHIRGLDNIPPGNQISHALNKITLVMIDNRIIYSYMYGGTLWETLPITLEDIERVEIIRGPSAALYGSNAVSGVVNFITQKPDKEGIHAKVAYLAGETADDFSEFSKQQAYAGINYKTKRFSAQLNANYQFRKRFTTDYYAFPYQAYVPTDSLAPFIMLSPEETFPHPDRACDAYAVNGRFSYNKADDQWTRLSIGKQESFFQRAVVDNRDYSLRSQDYRSTYVDWQSRYQKFDLKTSYRWGNWTFAGAPGMSFDMNILNMALEYDLTPLEDLFLRPGISYQNARYQEKDKDDQMQYIQDAELSTLALHLRADYTLFEKWRLIAAMRGERYKYPDDWYYSFQLISSYKFNPRKLIRLLWSRSNSGPFVLPTYANFSNQVDRGNGLIVSTSIYGNKNLKLLTMDLLEFGFRSKFLENFHYDIELFRSKTSNPIYQAPDMNSSEPPAKVVFSYTNSPVEIIQWGISGSMKLILFRKLTFKPMITFQKTMLENYLVTPDSLITEDHKATPSVYGGFNIDFRLIDPLSINCNMYAYSKQTFIHSETSLDIAAKTLLNATINYKFMDQSRLFLSVRNILGKEDVEFAFTDKTATLLIVGLNLSI